MPYKGERAGKTGHASFIKNKDVDNFLASCAFMRPLDGMESAEVVEGFVAAPDGSLPESVIACDGSAYCAPLNEKMLPSTQIGYVKASLVMVEVSEYKDAAMSREGYVDPFRVAAMHQNAEAASIVLPGSNIIYQNSRDVASGFRKAIYDQCRDERTNWVKGEKFTPGSVGIELFRDLIEKGCFRHQHLNLPTRLKNGNTPYRQKEV